MEGLLNITVGQLLSDMAERFPDREAVKYTDRPFRMTWKELDAAAVRIGKGLLSLGIGKGDHVAIWATNVPEWLLLLFGTAKIGAVLVTVNTNYKVFEAEYLLRQSDTKCLVMSDGFKDVNYPDIVNELCPTLKEAGNTPLDNPMLPCLKRVVYIGEKQIPGMLPWAELDRLADTCDETLYASISQSLAPDEIINMQYTSGTTGFPKGVMLTHNNIVNNGKCIGDCMKFTDDDKLCIPVPFFHCFGLVLAIMACLTHGSTMVPIDAFQPIKVMEALQNEQCTAVHGVPTMFIAMLDHPNFKKYTFPRLRTGIMAGSPCPIKVMQQVVDEMGATDITIAFGQTEASPVCTQTTTDDSIAIRVSTVGRVLPYIEAKIIDPETNLELPPNTQGEFCARGYNIMRGYYKMPEATAQAIDADGWLHTGDLATMDENGYFKITGRIKDMIIRGGENIYPKEIEEFLYTHPQIKDVQVVGLPSKDYGEEVMACIVLKEGATITADDVKAYVKSHMARHKTPRYIHFMDGFPMTASGKIQKYKLREMGVELFNLKDAAAVETA